MAVRVLITNNTGSCLLTDYGRVEALKIREFIRSTNDTKIQEKPYIQTFYIFFFMFVIVAKKIVYSTKFTPNVLKK